MIVHSPIPARVAGDSGRGAPPAALDVPPSNSTPGIAARRPLWAGELQGCSWPVVQSKRHPVRIFCANACETGSQFCSYRQHNKPALFHSIGAES
jgi:hypothetical protein